MAREIPKAYEPNEVEQRWAKAWYDEKLFRAENSAYGPRFSIALPPPNVTGSIHIGHMLEHTQIDMLVRWHRMRGDRTLWLPGMDHAGIATQFVVERMLAQEGIRRQDLGREEFERRVWKWKQESGGVIKQQMIRLGASCDWTRERFTLEPALYRAVLHAFLRFYREGLIYRGRYMVNWCPRCQTAISDLEVVHHERTGEIWNIRYPLIDANGNPSASEYLVVATTRPETMLGDTAVAVNPHDDRYRKFVGRKILLPLMNRQIPVITDPYVDREFGTGVVKITPAHDPNDFEVGKRHNLPEIDVMTETGLMNQAAGPYSGLERFAARGRIVEDLKKLGLVESVKEHLHAVGTCDRCKAIIEPRISTQWFLKMSPLAEPAKQVVRQRLIEVVPDNQRTILLNWLESIRDWCISRQLWWGHRIPIWHCSCGEMIPARDSQVEIVEGHARAASIPTKCPKCGGSRLTHDPDVLDTWFSSALWPFSTLGWPDETKDLREFYPTSLLISGYDILFFWDARMIMLGIHLMADPSLLTGDISQRIPFRQLYLHSLVRTAEGAKMSKTKGTGVDPLQMTEQYGTDALRYMLASMAAPGTDIILSEDRLLSARAFANKIWNAARFLFVNLDRIEAQGISLEELSAPEVRAKAPYRVARHAALLDRWMFSRLSAVSAQVSDALTGFRFHEACQTIYHFFWGDFCDWYIEWLKPQLASEDRTTAIAAWRNILAVFDAALRLLHPVMPFITEELWHRFPQRAGASQVAAEALASSELADGTGETTTPPPVSIALTDYPRPNSNWSDADAEVQMILLQDIIISARNIRAEMKLDPKKKVPADFSSADANVRKLVEANLEPILRLGALTSLNLSSGRLDPSGAVIRSTARFDLRIAYGEAIDKSAEIAKAKKEIERLEKDVASKEARLADQSFRSKAPREVVGNMEKTVADRKTELAKLRARLAELQS
ncbi:MAG TPA: valine--tRNA ligase [Candidatus Acidoferrum sp.]|nr:valine--tRNA ligase [Candidatus Acidoferrum sp.]